MTTIVEEKLPLDEVCRAAVRHDIRKAALREEEERVKAKAAELSKYKTELLSKVDEHVEDLQKMQLKAADLAKFKGELLARVEDHLKEVERADDTHALLNRFKAEMLEKVRRFSSAEQPQQ